MSVGVAGRGLVCRGMLLLLCLVGGCGWPTPISVYVPMDDDVELAVDLWLPQDMPAEGGVPTIVRFTRYWRDYDLWVQVPPAIGRYIQSARWLNESGYAVALVDVRGTGASFGESSAPWSPREVADYRIIVGWLAGQEWSNGRVGALGVSYGGVAADWVGALNHPAVYAVLPTYAYSDVYLDVSHPGGLLNKHFTQAWGEVSARMDRNDTSFLELVTDANPTGLPGPGGKPRQSCPGRRTPRPECG